eukprot:757246-Hanusia_phi.AAC.1
MTEDSLYPMEICVGEHVVSDIKTDFGHHLELCCRKEVEGLRDRPFRAVLDGSNPKSNLQGLSRGYYKIVTIPSPSRRLGTHPVFCRTAPPVKLTEAQANCHLQVDRVQPKATPGSL